MEPLSLFKNNKERQIFFGIILLIFFLNIFILYKEFQLFKKNEIYQTSGTILNIYHKPNYDILKIQNSNFTFFTPVNSSLSYKTLQKIQLLITTEKITFFEYLKGFYTKSFHLTSLNQEVTTKESLQNFITLQHQNNSLSSLYNALFLATNVDETIREVCSNFGVSHLIALSGFHLGVISVVLYFIFHTLYNPIHQRYSPYRNKRYDIMILVTLCLFAYLIFVQSVPSLLRAFVMFVFALFLLRNNIKVFSFETLFIVVLLILALFPKLLFSLSLWFSVAGVFYIFLFLQYFKNLNKYLQILLFNFWIYFAMNPIVHYFFGTTTLEQLFSPLLTLVFTLFYPMVVMLHTLEFGWLFDEWLLWMIEYPMVAKEIFTPIWLFIGYIGVSLLAIFYKIAFQILNIVFLSFGFYLFYTF